MINKIENFNGLWGLFERGVVTECEFVHPFLDELDVGRVGDEWSSLPQGYREVIAQHLREFPPEAMPRYFVLGQATEEEIDQLTEVRREKAKALVAHLDRLSNPAHQSAPPDSH